MTTLRLKLVLALAVTLLAVLASSGPVLSAPAGRASTVRDYYELRTYHFDNAAQQMRYEDYLQAGLLPAMNRAGISPVGAFTVENKPEEHSVTLLIPYASLESFATLDGKLAQDAGLRAAGSTVWNLPSSDPPYTRIESSLLLAFTGMPELQLPAETAAKEGRAFELRTYSSHSERAGLTKIQMFNRGEIDVFRRAGFQPVFYGQTLIGKNRPSLTYMVTYPDGVDRGSLWARFGADPECKRLFATPGYQDKEIVSKIEHVFLRPTAYSEI